MSVSLGFVFGLMISAILVVLIFKITNKDGKVRTEYDERQKAVRGNAYRYAFYAGALAEAAVMCVLMSGIELPVEPYALVFFGLMISCTVLAGYCVWHDVYWGLNNDHRRYNIIIAAAVVLNIFPVAMAAKGGSLMENGKLGMASLNITVLIMMVVILILSLIRRLLDSREEREE